MHCNKKNIYLIGYRCTGKTTIGRILASMLGFSFLDTDREIEIRESASIASIVKNYGWEKFRSVEQEVLFKTEKVNNYVISTGGGIVILPGNVQFMKKNGIVIWLKASVDTIITRMSADPLSSGLRPSLTGGTIKDETNSILRDRIPLYENGCDFQFDTSQLLPKEIAERIMRKINFCEIKGNCLSEHSISSDV